LVEGSQSCQRNDLVPIFRAEGSEQAAKTIISVLNLLFNLDDESSFCFEMKVS
jgi:hypothetical protein